MTFCSIAIAQDQIYDRLRRNRIEAGGRRVIKHDRRPVHESARHRNSPAHAAGKLRGIFFDRLFHFHEPQRFADARIDLLFGYVIFAQPKSNVLLDRERIEQRALLKYESDAAPKVEKLFLAHFGHFLAQ